MEWIKVCEAKSTAASLGVPQNPPAEIALKTYSVKIENNGVYVLI